MNNKTHYRKAFNSPYLSSADIVEPMDLTISHVVFEKDKAPKKKNSDDFFNTAYFKEKEIRPGEALKPMILNVGNCEIVKGFAGGSAYIDDWKDIRVTIYAKNDVKFGRDVVGGLRIMPVQPVRHVLKQGTTQWENAIAACKRDGNLNKVKARVDVTPEDEKLIMELSKK